MDCKASHFPAIKNISKSQAILLYIIQKTDGGFGHIKMMKTILKADQEIFKTHFCSFSGYKYTKEEFGPYSAMLETDIAFLLQNSFISRKEKREEHPQYTYNILFTERSWYKDCFCEEEWEILDNAIDAISPLGSLEASKNTHDWVYHSIEDGEEIPLFLYLEPAPITKEHKAEAMRLFNA